MKQVILAIIALFHTMQPMDGKPKPHYKLVISKESISPYKNSMRGFIDKRRSQERIMSNPVGYFFSSMWISATSFFGASDELKDVDPKEAAAFLERAFADEQALTAAIEKVEQDEANVAYLQSVLGSLSIDDITKKNTGPLPKLMKTLHHAKMPTDAKPWEKDKVPDDLFYQYAACNFLAYHIVESDGPARIKDEQIKLPEPPSKGSRRNSLPPEK